MDQQDSHTPNGSRTGWTAGLIVKTYPSGIPGKVRITVENIGPERLDEREAIYLLEHAAAMLKLKIGQDEAPQAAQEDPPSAPPRGD